MMAATTAGALKATVESMGLGLSVYRDGAPEGAAYPHVVAQEAVGLDFDMHGDADDPTSHQGTRELVQLDLLEVARVVEGGRSRSGEDPALKDRLIAGLNRCTPTLQQHAPWRVYGCRVQSGLRFPIADNVARTVLTVLVTRDTERLTQ